MEIININVNSGYYITANYYEYDFMAGVNRYSANYFMLDSLFRFHFFVVWKG